VKCKEAALRGNQSAQRESRAVWCIVCLLMTGILPLPAIWNGFPLLNCAGEAVQDAAGAPF
jgi:hypothetical protein